MKRLASALQARLNLKPVWQAVRGSHAPQRISIAEAPPISLGRLAATLVVMLVASGFGLLLYYEPTTQGAAASLESLHGQRPVGWLVHNAHRWSALLLLALVTLHALRTWLARAYRPPRDINWWIGLGLLLLTIGMGGSGYLLRWDIKAFALMDLLVSSFSRLPAIGPVVLGAMLGGTELDQVPLYRGYAFHVWVLPMLLVSLAGAHLLVAWRQGLAERPRWWSKLRRRLPARPGLSLAPGAALLLLVILLSAATPHEGRAGPTDRSIWPHPDWILGFYLLPFWVFDLGTQVLGTAVVPAAVLALLLAIPRLIGATARPWILTALAVLGVAGVAWMFGQMALIGSTIPTQGCTACHRPGILGGAPTTLSEFNVRDPDWLVYHLREPEVSILEPARPPETLP